MASPFSLPIQKIFRGTFFMSDSADNSSTQKIISAIDHKKTKVVATIGPVTESEEQIANLIAAGMNVARFNTKHNTPAWHKEVSQRVRKVAAEMHVPIGILIDLQGPEIRITLKQDQLTVKKDDQLVFTSQELSHSDTDVLLPPNVIDCLEVGNHIITDEGACHFVIVSKTDGHFAAECQEDCVLKNRKTVNTPNVVVEMPALLPRDEEFITELSGENIEYFALSFVRTVQDIEHLRNILSQKNQTADIVSKIENRKSVENLESIIAASDAVMVARGDLAMEVDFEELIYWQKKIIRLSQKHAKPVITATQMLLSMTQKPTPTRAEISDVANAVYDGTDALMLSEETTQGKYPIKCVEVFTRIAHFYEEHPSEYISSVQNTSLLAPLAQSILETVNKEPKAVEKIVIIGDDVNVCRQLSSFHLSATILAITHTLQAAQKLTLSYGVQPMYLPTVSLRDTSVNELMELLKQHQKLSLGERVLFIYNFVESKENAANQPLLREVI
jgi:pyruvate kinase